MEKGECAPKKRLCVWPRPIRVRLVIPDTSVSTESAIPDFTYLRLPQSIQASSSGLNQVRNELFSDV